MANTNWGNNWVITVNVTENPKAKFKHTGAISPSYQRFALYRTGLTVAEYKALVLTSPAGGKGYAAADLIWDTARGFITIAPPNSPAVAAPGPLSPAAASMATAIAQHKAGQLAAAARQPSETPAQVAARLGVTVAPAAKVTVGRTLHAA